MSVFPLRLAIRFPLYVAGLTIAGAAHTATRSTLDLSASVGASSNPLLRLGGKGSAFGRISALGTHEWRSERTTTSISLFGENTTYLQGGYGSKQIFDLAARSVHQVNPNLSIFGNVGFQGDFGGQLSSRFATSTPDFNPLPTDQLPPSAILDDPTYIGFDGRQYRLSGQVGLSMRVSARSSVALSAGAQRNFATGSLRNGNYNSYFGTLSYDTRFSERTSAGVGVNVQYQDYDNGRSSSVINPVVTARHQFSSQVQGSASVGLLLTRQNEVSGGTIKSVNPSFSFNLCKATERDRLCGRASREVRNSFGLASSGRAGSLVITTTAGVDYSRQIDSNQSVQVSFSANRYSTKILSGNDLSTTYLTFLTGYDRKLGQRLAAGANFGVRQLILAGPDPKADYSGTVYVRYRLGDLQ